MTLRSISIHFPTERQTMEGGFSVNRFGEDHDARFMDPYLMVDAFAMSENFFAPHPHAGFAPTTYLLPESEIGIYNRDSTGVRNVINPGSVLVNVAGRGMMHEEPPMKRGTPARGLQIFINLPTAQKFIAPQIVHVDHADVPKVEKNSVTIRAALGSSNGVTSPAKLPYPVRLIDVTLQPDATFEQELLAEENCFIYLFEGDAVFEGADRETKIALYDVVGTQLGGTMARIRGGAKPARFTLFAGVPIGEPIVSYGPFVMSSRDDIVKVMADYRQGKMGSLGSSSYTADGNLILS